MELPRHFSIIHMPITGTLKYDHKPRDKKRAGLWCHRQCAALVGGTREIWPRPWASDLSSVSLGLASWPRSPLGRGSPHSEGVVWLAESWKYGFKYSLCCFLMYQRSSS